MNTRSGLGPYALLPSLVLSLLLLACGAKNPTSAASFVGKWQSSKLATPLFLYDNGEWEIKNDQGGILQYGVWEYRDGHIRWLFKHGAQIDRDVNAVVSVNAQEFRLQEGAQVTVFRRLD